MTIKHVLLRLLELMLQQDAVGIQEFLGQYDLETLVKLSEALSMLKESPGSSGIHRDSFRKIEEQILCAMRYKLVPPKTSF